MRYFPPLKSPELNMVKTVVVRTPRVHKRKSTHQETGGVRKRASPDTHDFVTLSQVPPETSSPEHECLLHTSEVISRRIQLRTQRACDNLTGSQNSVLPVADFDQQRATPSKKNTTPDATSVPTATYIPVAQTVGRTVPRFEDW